MQLAQWGGGWVRQLTLKCSTFNNVNSLTSQTGTVARIIPTCHCPFLESIDPQAECPIGMRRSGSSCTPCDPGEVSPSCGSSSCDPCPSGTSTSAPGAFACAPQCAPGQRGLVAPFCLNCSLGSYSTTK